MKKYTIEHNKPDCISCGACAAVAEKFFEMESEGECKSHLKGSKKIYGDKEKLEISEEDYEVAKEAADCCPVNVIHIKDEKGNKII